MATFVIDSDVPVPTTQRIRTRGEFATTCDMLEVGQSFFVAGRTTKGVYASLSPKKFGGNKKFRPANVPASVNAAGEVVPAGIRVWRTA